MSRDLGRVLPTHASGNRHTDLSPRCGLSSDPCSRNPWKNCLRQSHMDDRAIVKVQVSSREVPAHHWSKKKNSKIGHIKDRKRNIFTWPLLCLSQGGIAQCQETTSWPMVFPNRENMWLNAWFPQLWRTLQRNQLLSHPSQIAEVCCVTEGWGISDIKSLSYQRAPKRRRSY